ncbi:hypothetical protein WEB32_21320 [Streptomyces netropsis]|uniref:hypothetical protein n=1 Tax=Streptomyces netropsis TaxID=55404 RepID=UPI0030CEAA6D
MRTVTARTAARAATRTLGPALALALGLAALAGCGIRGTAVPVDAGSAPSRATCVVRSGAQSLPPSGSVALSVQLVCGSQLLPVPRVMALPESTPEDALAVAQALLEELRRAPSSTEADAGFSTDVPLRLSVSGPRKDDPAGTLRLSRAPEELPPLAVAQLACTFTGTAAAGGKAAVVLGGPGDEAPKRFACTDEVRTRPETVRGTAV